MELTDEAKAEIQSAIKILKEDGAHIHRTYAAFLKSQEPTDPPTEPTEGGPPPKTEPKQENTQSKGGLWWGNRSS
jgi:hypothetical protein